MHELSLTLVLLEPSGDGFRFRLVIRNRSDAKLLLPYPEIPDLRFANQATMQESEWYVCFFQTSGWGGITLQPGEEKALEYRVRPCDLEAPKDDDTSDYYRWCVALPPGEYWVWFRFEVGEDYFCPDSHYHYEEIARDAAAIQAVAWKGQVVSNRLSFSRD